MRKCILLFLSVILCTIVAISQQPYKVFLMAGQSNMAGTCGNDQDPELVALSAPDENIQIKVFGTASYGWGPIKSGLGSVEIATGPELTFGHDMADYYSGNNQILIIKGAWSGTDLNVNWRPPSSGGTTGELYTTFVSTVKASLAELDVPYEIVGMCWLQGESDCFNLAFANLYEKNLTNFIADLRKDFNEPDMFFSIGQIMEDPVYTHFSVVRKAEQIVAEKDPLTGIFDPEGLPISGGHWIMTACGDIGHGFASNMISLIEDTKRVGIAYAPWFPPTTWGSEGGCTWAMPALGAYRSDDIAVIDQHIDWLTDAGVDFLQLDWSNNINYTPGCNCLSNIKAIEDASEVLFDRMVWRKNNGKSWMKVAIMIGAGADEAAYSDGRMNAKVNQLKTQFLDKPDRRSVYYEHRGKPLVVNYCNGSWNYNNWNHTSFDSSMTIRNMFATLVQNNMYNSTTKVSKDGLWSWSENVHPPAYSNDGRPECLTLHAALRTCGWFPINETYPSDMQGCMNQWGGAKGKRNGATLKESFQYAREYNVDLAMVMSFNEWTGCNNNPGEQKNPEFSNDIEPMEGGYGDLYLRILKEEIRKFKGNCNPQTISFKNTFTEVTDSTLMITATSGSGLPVMIEVVSGPAVIDGNLLSFTKSSGTVTLRAYQDGNDTICSGEAYTSFTIDHQCIAQTISFQAINDQPVSQDTIKLIASSNRDLLLDMPVVTGPAFLINDSTFQLTGQRGTVKVEISQSGSYTYCAASSVTQSFTVALPPHACNNCDGYVNYERWNNIIGGTVDLIPINLPADYNSTLTSMDMPKDIGDDYGARIKGYLCAPYTGNYTFYIAGDDGVQFWLSTDIDQENKKLVAFHNGWTPYQDWTVFPTQKSEAVSLIGGEKYYMEALLKEYKGGDHLSVRWTGPNLIDEIISGEFLIPSCKTQTITLNPSARRISDSCFIVSATSNSGLPVSFEIINGAATINVDTIQLTAKSARLTIKGTQDGNTEYCTAQAKQMTFVLNVLQTTDVNPALIPGSFELFPNPSKNHITVRIDNSGKKSGQIQLKIIDICGRTMLFDTIGFGGERNLDISDFPKGIYIVQLSTPAEKFTKKLIKQ